MIVRFFNTGTGNGEAPVKYLLSAHSHDGEERAHKPELLEGSPALTIELINGIQRKYKYASGCLAFRSAEQPTRAELLRILDQFKKLWHRVCHQTNSTPYLCCTESDQTRLLGLRDFMSTSCCQ